MAKTLYIWGKMVVYVVCKTGGSTLNQLVAGSSPARVTTFGSRIFSCSQICSIAWNARKGTGGMENTVLYRLKSTFEQLLLLRTAIQWNTRPIYRAGFI